jgi:hypothetical protein
MRRSLIPRKNDQRHGCFRARWAQRTPFTPTGCTGERCKQARPPLSEQHEDFRSRVVTGTKRTKVPRLSRGTAFLNRRRCARHGAVGAPSHTLSDRNSCSRTNAWRLSTHPRRRIPAFCLRLCHGIKATSSCVCVSRCVCVTAVLRRERASTIIDVGQSERLAVVTAWPGERVEDSDARRAGPAGRTLRSGIRNTFWNLGTNLKESFRSH